MDSRSITLLLCRGLLKVFSIPPFVVSRNIALLGTDDKILLEMVVANLGRQSILNLREGRAKLGD